jgi:uncharacterized coiled-coil protein SlyX
MPAPTYAELEARVAELEQDAIERAAAIAQLQRDYQDVVEIKDTALTQKRQLLQRVRDAEEQLARATSDRPLPPPGFSPVAPDPGPRV